MYRSLIDIPLKTCEKYPDRVSHRFRSEDGFIDRTYSNFVDDFKALTAGLSKAGVNAEDHVAFFVNNRYEWSLTDFALQGLSAISVPRGSDTTPTEAEFIYNHSDSRFLILENLKQLDENQKISEKAEKIFIIDFPDQSVIESSQLFDKIKDKVKFYPDLISEGCELIANEPDFYENKLNEIKYENIVSIIYTSGTTGNPKGVVLRQSHFVENVIMTVPRMGIDEKVGEVTVTVLPAWHAFERTYEYGCLASGVSFVYSSLRYFSQDILREKPHILASVPRLWDSIYTKMNTHMRTQSKMTRKVFFFMVNVNTKYKKSRSYLNHSVIQYKKEKFLVRVFKSIKAFITIFCLFFLHLVAERIFKGVRDKVGGRLRFALSGGGSLPMAVDEFFHSVGIGICNAYGMTECAPGITGRIIKRNTLGTVGPKFDDTELKILDEDGNPVAQGEKGLLYVKGPQVMSGYYKNPEATAEVLSEDGWLLTGDLARETIYGDIVLAGRSKDTIVLLGGENIDPLAIEDKISESEMVDHVMLLGQDKKGLTAFIALNEQAVKDLANDLKVKVSDLLPSGDDEHRSVGEQFKLLEKKIREEIDSRVNKESGFKPFEKITKVILVENKFKIGEELTQTLKIKRKQIMDRYHKLIDRFMKDDK